MTTETQEHTPAPWVTLIDGTMSGRWIAILGRENYFSDGSPQEIAQTPAFEVNHGSGSVWEREPDADEIEANARLMAAAPELLEALESLLRTHVDVMEPSDDDSYQAVKSRVERSERLARAAISKARGDA